MQGRCLGPANARQSAELAGKVRRRACVVIVERQFFMPVSFKCYTNNTPTDCPCQEGFDNFFANFRNLRISAA